MGGEGIPIFLDSAIVMQTLLVFAQETERERERERERESGSIALRRHFFFVFIS